MTDFDEHDDTNETPVQSDMPRPRCAACRGKGKVAIVGEDGSRAAVTCPVCCGRGRIPRGSCIRGPRSARNTGLFPGQRRPAGGGRPSRRGPLLPLTIRAENYEPPTVVRDIEPVMPTTRHSFRPHLEAYSHLDEREHTPTSPSRGNIESADLIVSIAKATNLDARSLSRIRLADVLWGNSAIYIRHGTGSGQQVHIPPELRSQLYHYLQDRLVAGVPDDPEGSIFQESIQDISECLARAEAQERWKSLSDPVDALLDNPCAANGTSTDPLRGVLVDSLVTGPRPGANALPQTLPAQVKQPGSDLITDSLTAGPQKSPTAMVDAIMGVSESATDLPDKDRNGDILGIAGNTGINLL